MSPSRLRLLPRSCLKICLRLAVAAERWNDVHDAGRLPAASLRASLSPHTASFPTLLPHADLLQTYPVF